MIDEPDLAPFVLDRDGEPPTPYSLILFDGDMEDVEDVFEQLNAESNGHGWEGLATSLVRSHMPELADRLHFGSESGTFVVLSGDLDALRRLGNVLREAFHDRTLLAEHIQNADPDLLPR
jgi:Immunity protein 51